MRSRTPFPVFSLLVVGALSLQASYAFAQVADPRPERPDRGLFKNRGAGEGDRLDLNGSVGAGWDDNVLLDLPGVNDPRTQAKSGTIGTLSGGLSYTRRRTSGNFNASASSSARYYPGQTIDHITGHSANIGGAFSTSDRTSLYASQLITYQPLTFNSIFPQSFAPVFDPTGGEPVEAIAPSLDQAATKEQYLTYATTAGISHRLSRRTTFSAGYIFQQSDTAYSSSKFSNQGANAGLRFSLTRSLGLRLGYGYQQADYLAGVPTYRTHNIDAGVDFSRALSFSRRTTLTFSTGTTALTNGDRTQYQAVGGANLNHEMGRTWNATISYDRSFQFVETLLQPVFYDSASAGVGGLINRRVRVQTNARASIGHLGFAKQEIDNDFDTYQGSASLSFALSRFADLGADYSIYRYRFGTGALLPPGVARNVNRQSVGIHVTLWAPLYNRARRA